MCQFNRLLYIWLIQSLCHHRMFPTNTTAELERLCDYESNPCSLLDGWRTQAFLLWLLREWWTIGTIRANMIDACHHLLKTLGLEKEMFEYCSKRIAVEQNSAAKRWYVVILASCFFRFDTILAGLFYFSICEPIGSLFIDASERNLCSTKLTSRQLMYRQSK